MKAAAAAEGSSTLLVTLVLLLLTGACLALLMATQTGMLIAAQHRSQVRLLAAADGGLELGVARGIAGASGQVERAFGGVAAGSGAVVQVSGFEPVAKGHCDRCMANLEGGLGALGGLRRVSHEVTATASLPARGGAVPAAARKVSALVDLMPWPAPPRDRWDLAPVLSAARRQVRTAALAAIGQHDENAPIAVVVVEGSVPGDGDRTIAVAGVGVEMLAVEVSPRAGLLWRFGDSADADGNGAADLGPARSAPALVTLRLEGGERAVALFGGGFDSNRPTAVGNWLYALDLDTGSLLYKRQVDGPLAATPAVADLTGDGVADAIHAGTLAGVLYRVDVSTPARLAGGRIAPRAWSPRQVFDTGGEPIHHPPAVVPAPTQGVAVLALGVGPGLDAPAVPGSSGTSRMLVVVDRGKGLIGSAADLPAIDPDDPAPGTDRLAPGLPPEEQGWSLALGAGERLASPPLAAGGLLTFLTSTATGSGAEEVRRHSLWLASADAAGGARSTVVAASLAMFPAHPVRVEIDHAGRRSGPWLDAAEEQVLGALRAALPAACGDGAARLRIDGAGPDTALVRLAVLPVCRLEVDWFEHGEF